MYSAENIKDEASEEPTSEDEEDVSVLPASGAFHFTLVNFMAVFFGVILLSG